MIKQKGTVKYRIGQMRAKRTEYNRNSEKRLRLKKINGIGKKNKDQNRTGQTI